MYIIQAINWAITNNLDVISISLGSDSYYSPYEYACQKAYDAGIVVVAAAGNSDSDDPNYPSDYSSVISVGALTSSNNRWNPWGSDGSNYGNCLELMAYGSVVKTTQMGGGFTYTSGTSYATPAVAGLAALMLSKNPNLTPGEIRGIMRETALDLGDSGWDKYYGYGRITCPAAMAAVGTTPLYLPFREEGNTYYWSTTDTAYDKIVNGHSYDGRTCDYHYEDISHWYNYMFVEGPIIDLRTWSGTNNLELKFCYRAKSGYSGSAVTQLRIKFYDRSSHSYHTYTNPSAYDHYWVHQNSRLGQTWINGYDSGWQVVSMELLASEFNQFAGTKDLQVQWGHYDAWDTDWFMRQYLDFMYIEEQVTPNEPRYFSAHADITDISLSWKSPTNILATKYYLEVNQLGQWVRIATLEPIGSIESYITYLHTNLIPGRTYYYRLCALNLDNTASSYIYEDATTLNLF